LSGDTSLATSSSDSSAAPLRVEANQVYTAAEFVGLYRPDGRFKKPSKLASLGTQSPSRESLRPAEVPASINLHPVESVVEDYEPPAHAIRTATGHSLLAALRDGLVTLAYGRERVLQAPTHVTTDTTGRLIISDPDMPAVHVLDVTGKASFRIAGGPQHRLRMPKGVATDADDNIYVADSKKGLILVYDPRGGFVRYIGSFRGESMFQRPSGIAIDRKAGHLYVLDSPAHQLVMLDLQGEVLRRVGNKHGAARQLSTDSPTEIALGEDMLVILDSGGSRIQVFDLQCNFQTAFTIRSENAPPLVSEIGLAVDRSSNIYLSNLGESTVRIYSRDGRLRGVLGRPGSGVNEFKVPRGIWIDPGNRLYVSDTGNSRIVVYRVPAQRGEPPRMSGRSP
jgi:DNA-binding beta-propeller fold protein YncE